METQTQAATPSSKITLYSKEEMRADGTRVIRLTDAGIREAQKCLGRSRVKDPQRVVVGRNAGGKAWIIRTQHRDLRPDAKD
jgi:hypothetical protein